MKALVIGAGGQLGRELVRAVPPGVALATADLPSFDLERAGALDLLLKEEVPDVTINAAAFTAVDAAESERERAFCINGEAPARLAQLVSERSARLIHVSTDFVFDGERARPYRPDDEPRPLGAYGESKLAGERGVRCQCPRAVIVRTAWLYSGTGQNFVKTMLRIMRERGAVRVVADQVGTPTWARGLAHALWMFAVRPDLSGIFHWTDAGVASWYDFATAIAEEARETGQLTAPVHVEPISTSQYPTPARRPSFSVLDKVATWEALGTRPPHWRVQLRHMLAELSVEEGR
ncbi:MAG: dTDP-4-dehydrorhamnose reductase [Polyangiaceae bacterium]|nr:dTDP-4-dehydrorhamnose reductase [Polyangiaceae bacterium]